MSTINVRRAHEAPNILRLQINGKTLWIEEDVAVEGARQTIATAATPKHTFGSMVRAKRAEHGLSQQELADLVGISRTYISQVENDKAPELSLRIAQRIAKALGSSIDELFGKESKVAT